MTPAPQRGPACSAARPAEKPRVDWVDTARGLSIILVVMMHSTLGVGLALGETGWLHEAVAFAKPFRIPAFFMIAGLFAGRHITRPWREYLDSKVAHFAYFYTLWLAIVLAVKSGELGLSAPGTFIAAYGWALLEPFSTLWFIFVLPIFFVMLRILWRLPAALVGVFAISIHLLAASAIGGDRFTLVSHLTPSTAINGFLMFFVFFYFIAICADRIFALTRWVAANRVAALSVVGLWTLLNLAAVKSGLAHGIGASLILGLAGGLAMMAMSALIATMMAAGWMAYCGQNSLVIYLAFVLPMAATRLILLKTGWMGDPGLMSACVTIAAVSAPLLLERITRKTWFAFLFTRPQMARLGPAKPEALQALPGRCP